MPIKKKMATVTMPAPETVTIPMQQHVGAPCVPLVKKGDHVYRGQKIGDSTAVDILTDRGIAAAANLKLTSLYELAIRCGIDDPQSFVRNFIDYERREERNESKAF